MPDSALSAVLQPSVPGVRRVSLPKRRCSSSVNGRASDRTLCCCEMARSLSLGFPADKGRLRRARIAEQSDPGRGSANPASGRRLVFPSCVCVWSFCFLFRCMGQTKLAESGLQPATDGAPDRLRRQYAFLRVTLTEQVNLRLRKPHADDFGKFSWHTFPTWSRTCYRVVVSEHGFHCGDRPFIRGTAIELLIQSLVIEPVINFDKHCGYNRRYRHLAFAIREIDVLLTQISYHSQLVLTYRQVYGAVFVRGYFHGFFSSGFLQNGSGCRAVQTGHGSRPAISAANSAAARSVFLASYSSGDSTGLCRRFCGVPGVKEERTSTLMLLGCNSFSEFLGAAPTPTPV